MPPIITASLGGRTSDVSRELDRGASIETVYGTHTPLVHAALRGHADTVKLLLARGANPAFKDSRGRTALMWAEEKNQGEIVRILREAEAKGSDAVFKDSDSRRSPGNLDDAAYARMRSAAGMPPENKEPVSDVDAPARRGAERPDDFALVIGVEDYQALPKADYGARDARTVRKHFEAMGVPARNVIALEGAQATGSKMRNYLQQWLPRNVKPESTVFVYYSGHGAPDPERGDAYLVPWDADPMFLTTSAYPLKQFYAELAKLKAKRVIVALDACFSGSGGRSVLAKGARPLVAKVDESVPSAANLTVLAAASGTEITGSLDEQAHGIFTYHFLKALSGGAKTPRALYDYLKPRVQDDARRQNREQSPTLAGSGTDVAF
ncbi:MAG: caspase family protein [Elusimicrobia bacterium]|nr:caspase family protein [Elusimicrobiota bacterium]